MQTQNDPNDLLFPSDLEKMGIGRKSTQAKWRLAGTGPVYIKLGSRVAHRRHDVDQWLESRKRSSTSQGA